MEKRLEHFLRSATEHGWKIIQKAQPKLALRGKVSQRCPWQELPQLQLHLATIRSSQASSDCPSSRRSGPWKSFPTNFCTRLNLN